MQIDTYKLFDHLRICTVFAMVPSYQLFELQTPEIIVSTAPIFLENKRFEFEYEDLELEG